MKIFGDNPTFDESLTPLFEAMKEGRTITEIVFMRGSANKDNPNEDLKYEDFKLEQYYCGMQYSPEGTPLDYVATDKGTFYMSWVRNFTI